jgi:uncharacterized phiE125 gp8 family phage protein
MKEPRYKIKTAASIAPVALAEFKRNLHIGAQDETDSTQDTYLQEILDYVTEGVQQDIGRRLCRETWYGYLDDFPDTDEDGNYDLLITLGPVEAVSSVKYYPDGSSSLTTMTATDYQLSNIELTARLRFFKTYSVDSDKMDQVVIEFTNGWATAAEVPKQIRQAIVLLATEFYLNPENMQLNFGMALKQSAAERLLRNYRVQRF